MYAVNVFCSLLETVPSELTLKPKRLLKQPLAVLITAET